MLKCTVFLKVTFLSIAISWHSFSLGYEIGGDAELIDSKKLKLTKTQIASYEFQRNHEIMTALAIQCLDKANENEMTWSNKPKDCLFDMSEEYLLEILVSYFEENLKGDNDPNFVKYKDLISYVRWPDDPLRLTHEGDLNAVSFGAYLKGICQRKNKGISDDDLVPYKNGLICSSHYGQLQFLHSMANADDIPAYQTMSLIEQWANFAFKISVNREFKKQSYCQYWKENKELLVGSIENNGSEPVFLADMMYQSWMDDKNPCNEVDNFWAKFNFIVGIFGRPYADKKAAWSLSTTFNWICDRSFFGSGTRNCNQYVDARHQPGGWNVTIELSALGSIIHMVQDSFSKAHTIRVENEGETGAEAEIILDTVRGFRSYKNQDEDKHKVSDKVPTLSKASSSITDPVTATAQLIWLHVNHDNVGITKGVTINDILKGVYGPEIYSSNKPSEAGVHYKLD